MNDYQLDNDSRGTEADGAKPQKKVYVKNSELYAELEKWRDSNGGDESKPRVASDRLGEMLMKIAAHYMNHPNYVRYPRYIKEEIMSNSICAMFKALPCYKFDYKNPFAYFTQICWSCAMDYLIKYYKFVNFKRDIQMEYIANQIDEGVNVKSGTQYMKILNDLIPAGEESGKTMMENQEFIDSLLSRKPMFRPDEEQDAGAGNVDD